jgi:2-iminobutanoate/2-iminopropanoate deaminase
MARNVWLLLICLLALAGCRSGPQRVEHIKAEDAIGPYSGAVKTGDYCFVSGQIGKGGGSVEDEASSAIDNLEAELERAGLTLDDVVSCTVYLTDIVYYSHFNAVYAKRFKAPYPARACVAVKALPAKARVEIQAIALKR